MAARFWVGGTGTWDASTTTHWAASSNGAGGQSVPGPSDTVTFDGSSGGGTVTLAYDPTVVSITMGAFTGTFDAATFNPTVSTFNGSGTGTRTIKLGTGTWTVTGTGVCWNTSTVTGLTLVAGTSTIKLTDTSSTTKTFRQGVRTYYNVWFSGGGSGIFQYGRGATAHTSNDFRVDPGTTVQFFATATFNFSDLHLSGTAQSPIFLTSSTPGTAYNLVNPGWVDITAGNLQNTPGAYSMDWLNIADSNASGTSPWYAGANSVDSGGNTGWQFIDSPDIYTRKFTVYYGAQGIRE